MRYRGSNSPTSPITRRSGTAWFGSPSTGPRFVTRFGLTLSTSSTRPSTTPVDHQHRLCPSHRERSIAEGRRVGFLLGGDQRIRGRDGYKYAAGDDDDTVDSARLSRLQIPRSSV